MRAVDFPAGFRTGCSLACGVTFEDNGAVQDVAAEGEVEVFARVGFEADGLHCGEFVDGGEDGGSWDCVSSWTRKTCLERT